MGDARRPRSSVSSGSQPRNWSKRLYDLRQGANGACRIRIAALVAARLRARLLALSMEFNSSVCYWEGVCRRELADGGEM